jgi:hypothetical protein
MENTASVFREKGQHFPPFARYGIPEHIVAISDTTRI